MTLPRDRAMHGDAMLDQGDLDGQQAWLRIMTTNWGVRKFATGSLPETSAVANIRAQMC